MTITSNPQSGLVRRILGSPPVRILVLGFILLVMMGLNGDVMTSYAGEPVKAVLHIMALAIAGIAVYLGFACFVEQRVASELASKGMGRELGIACSLALACMPAVN